MSLCTATVIPIAFGMNVLGFGLLGSELAYVSHVSQVPLISPPQAFSRQTVRGTRKNELTDIDVIQASRYIIRALNRVSV